MKQLSISDPLETVSTVETSSSARRELKTTIGRNSYTAGGNLDDVTPINSANSGNEQSCGVVVILVLLVVNRRT